MGLTTLQAYMKLAELLSRQGIKLDLAGHSKKQVLQALADLAGETTQIDSEVIFAALQERERLGCTALGNGVAIPHARLCDGDRCHLMMARLDRPVDFDADDERDVDLVFCLIACEAAEQDPVSVLSKLKRLANDVELMDSIRNASSEEEVFQLLNAPKEKMLQKAA